MAAWQRGLDGELQAVAADFGIRIAGSGRAGLADARQTGFVWTRQPGVVCLAADRRYLAMALDNPSVVAVVVPVALAGIDPRGRALVVADRAEGTRRVYSIDPEGLGPLRAWLDRFWGVALEAFRAEVERDQQEDEA